MGLILNQPRVSGGKFGVIHGKYAGKRKKKPINPMDTNGSVAPMIINPPNQNKLLRNYIALVVDESGSMGGFRKQVIDNFNQTIQTIRDQGQRLGQENLVTFVKFHSDVREMFRHTSAAVVKDLDYNSYYPNDMTALYDAVGKAYDVLQSRHTPDGVDESFLVVILTDGCENASRKYGTQSIRQLIQDAQKTDKWTFSFQVPPGYKTTLVLGLGIPEGNVREWEQTTKGFKETHIHTQSALGSYMQARSVGTKSVRNFYNVTTDLSQVPAQKIHNQLTDISDQFKEYTLSKEQSIKEFTESKTKKPYVIGQTYYQLMKPEIVQPQKRVLIQEKGSKAVWGGKEARDLIGLKSSINAKVTPGNHSGYEIFCQSTSVNRILPRGTKVLIDTTMTQALAPTWDANQPGVNA